MKKVTMDTLIIFVFFTFTGQIIHIFGRVVILNGPELQHKVKLICFSEDDGGALVWNYNLKWKYYPAENNDYNFQDLNNFNNSEIDCNMNTNTACLKSWVKHYWNLTNSVKTPMGPVFDRRWEEFEQYEYLQDTHNYVDFVIPAEVKLSISFRVTSNANILICNGKNYDRDFCYWIIIGGWGNTFSVIRKCTTGVLLPEKLSDSDCQKELTFFEHAPLSETEWRSFIITWNSAKQKIIIYDTEKSIMAYEDKEKHEFSNNYMFIGSNNAMLFRLHMYNFLHTTVEGAVLTSPPFQLNNKIICIQLLIGLCADCDAHIVLRDYTKNEDLVTVTATGSSSVAEHDLPMWQSIKITKNFSETEYNNYSRMIIQLIPKLHKYSSNPTWAIANVRQCPDANALRKGTMISKKEYDNKIGYVWPIETCQKLFYDKHAIVEPLLIPVKSNINLDDANCPKEKIGPQCLFSCINDLNGNYDCRGSTICYENGCICTRGFLGDTCSTSCESNKYGYGCRKTCGSCLNEEQCDTVTGVCNNGCDKTVGIYIPPLCQISVDKPNAPTVISNETTIWAEVSITWKDEYEEISILYSFIIEGHIKYGQHTWSKLFQNMTHLTADFENLEVDTTYRIGFALDFNGIQVYSDWQTVETKCNLAENFDITPEENGMIIDWQINSKYSCPANRYYLVIHNVDTNEEVVSTLITFLPYKLYLPSCISFNVTILYKNETLFSQKIRTLDSYAPSRVLDLDAKLSANTKLTLIWKPPRQSNGEIVQYEAILKVKEYYGCTNFQLSTPDNHIIKKFTTEPIITILDLHPFTSYSAQVIAYNSYHFSMAAETIFNTTESEIPSEVFSQLRVENSKLLWSPPEDCTTITGSINAKINIHGISDAVKHYNVTNQTSYYSFNLNQLNPKLNGGERYVATVYVIRDYRGKENASAYQKHEFETPPTAPPKVINLEIVEIDTRQTTAMIHLRWQSPLPPLNGKLRDYSIQLCDKLCSVIKVQVNHSCDLWNDYICKVIGKPPTPAIIKVFAHNINVTEPGLPVIVTDEMLRNTTPASPGNYTYTVKNNSVIDLKWLHPWKTGGHLKSFRIQINEIFSSLKSRISQSSINEILEYPVTQYMHNYTKRLYLFPSTQYIIYIEAVTFANTSSDSKFVEVYTPSTAAFDGDLDVMMDKSDSTILLNIPSVLNDTQGSMMHIIVKGPNLCEQYSEVPVNLRVQAGVKMDEITWQAAEVLTSEIVGEQFKIGDNKTYGNAKNCPLKPAEFYEIVIIVTERNPSIEPIMLRKSIRFSEVPSKHYEVWIVPIILFLVMAGAAFYLYQRKRQKLMEELMQDEIVLSQNILVQNYKENPNSKQDLSIPCDSQSVSRSITPELLPIAVKKNKEKEIE